MKRRWIFELGDLEDDTIIRVFRCEEVNSSNQSKQNFQREVMIKSIREVLDDSSLTVEYDNNGAPYLNHVYSYVSISHCKDMYAFILSKNAQVGIDIEEFRASLIEGKGIYISEGEENLLMKDEHALIVWSAKEVGYKLAKGAVQNYKNDLTVENIDADFVQISVNNRKVRCDYRYIDKMLLMYAILS